MILPCLHTASGQPGRPRAERHPTTTTTCRHVTGKTHRGALSIRVTVPSDPAQGRGTLAAAMTHDVPISSIRLCKGAGRRKVSSLQDRVRVPTSSEFVANILALSSDRFTPAIDATSLMSSSSL